MLKINCLDYIHKEACACNVYTHTHTDTACSLKYQASIVFLSLFVKSYLLNQNLPVSTPKQLRREQ